MTQELAAPLWTKNGLAVSRGDIPEVPAADLRRFCVDLCSKAGRLAALFAMPVESQQPEKREEMSSSGAPGVGIRGMRERLRQLGGTLEIDSNGAGTVITVRLPISEAPSPANPVEVTASSPAAA